MPSRFLSKFRRRKGESRAASAEVPPLRVLILSQQKAGTYLLGELVHLLGFRQTYLHLMAEYLTAYDPNRMDEGRQEPERFRVNCPFAEAVKLVRTGEFAVGHIPHTDDAVSCLADFRLFFIRREVRSALLSFMRFVYDTGRGNATRQPWYEGRDVAGFVRSQGPSILRLTQDLAPWLEEPGVLSVKFEELRKGLPELVGHIARHLEVEVEDVACAASSALGVKTLTRATGYYDLAWTPQAEEEFTCLGGPELNEWLGYPEAQTPA